MEPLTGIATIFSAMKSSGSGGTSQLPPIQASATSSAGPSTSSSGNNTVTSGGGANLSGASFWFAIAAVAGVIGYIVVRKF